MTSSSLRDGTLFAEDNDGTTRIRPYVVHVLSNLRVVPMLCPINLYRKRDKKHSSPSRQSGARLSPDNEKYSGESELWVGGKKDLALRLMTIISLLSPSSTFPQSTQIW